ncbi:uncharacterized protein LOC130759901 [Actinidia eriantha]|uniref:uncharacterized protein LOC130759901 n=1 Tax=Actinidia eriantha TaxID=165200 RepID=UPI00258D26B2|nr:uncharacterized protein LOC130759901 [Actinidia eriantha]
MQHNNHWAKLWVKPIFSYTPHHCCQCPAITRASVIAATPWLDVNITDSHSQVLRHQFGCSSFQIILDVILYTVNGGFHTYFSTSTKLYWGKTDPAWAYCRMVDRNSKKNLVCMFCDKLFNGEGITRVKQHLACVKNETEYCKKVFLKLVMRRCNI